MSKIEQIELQSMDVLETITLKEFLLRQQMHRSTLVNVLFIARGICEDRRDYVEANMLREDSKKLVDRSSPVLVQVKGE